jgi:hypothetical protein
MLLAQQTVNSDELTKLKKERLQAAEEWLKMVETVQATGGGTDPSSFHELVQAIRAKHDSLLDLATTKDQRVAARKEAFEQLEKVHEKITLLQQVGRRGGEPVHFYSSKYEMLDAKIKWLEEAERK